MFRQRVGRLRTAVAPGQTVLLETDSTTDAVDQFGRLLRFVWLRDGRLANYEMLARGYAFRFDIPHQYAFAFRQAEHTAREQELGLWAPDTCDGQRVPVAAHNAVPTVAAGPVAADDLLACPFPGLPAGSAPDYPVRIVMIDKQAEIVRLQNVGPVPIDLEGWVMCSIMGNQRHQGIGGVLAPGETRDFPHSSENIWRNREPDHGVLYDAQGQLISFWEDQIVE
ncbi:MAG: hypothetical protein HC893_00470 [Chloroflexaceae bacterium]|nr:hypothetical protein [Chloroflexaceae bacterium]